jgi:hypothetical protein
MKLALAPSAIEEVEEEEAEIAEEEEEVGVVATTHGRWHFGRID